MILQVLRLRAVLFLLVCGSLPAADSVAWPRLLQPGCVVTYRLESAAPAAVPAAESGDNKPVECSLLILAVNGEKLDLQLTVEGVGSTLSVVRDGFDPGAILGAPPARQELTVVESPVEFKPVSLPRPVAATRTVWKGDPENSEIIRSAEIPFGLASLKSGSFHLEVTGYSWGNK